MFFLRKSEAMVHRLIEGPGVFICDECIGLCNDLLEKSSEQNNKANAAQDSDMVLPTPVQIKQKLDEYVVGQDEAKNRCQLLYTIIIKGFTQLPAVMMLNFRKATFCF